MATKTYTLLVTITSDEDECIAAPALADAIKGALETGINGVVIGGRPDQIVDPVHSAEADAFDGDVTRFPINSRDPVKAARKLHAALRAA